MAKAFERKYTPEQFAAVYDARFAKGLTYPRIAELAESGELISGQPFAIDVAYLGDKCRGEARRRQGKNPSAAAQLPPVDAVEHFRKRLVAIIESEIAALEREKEGKRDAKKISDYLRWLRELAAIPGPKDPRPDRAAGSNTPGVPRVLDAPRGGTVGALMAEFRTQAATPQNDEGPHDGGPSNGNAAG